MSEHFRSFGVVNDNTTDEEIQKQSVHLPKTQESLEALRRNIVGHLKKVDGPFGPKPLCYQDWTASGRPLQTVESYVQQNILPLYGNTHTTTSITSHQSTCFRHEARQIIAQAINAKTTGRAAEDLVLFTGTGTTAAVNKLVIAMGLHVPLPAGYNEEDRPVVFTSFYEHHSNLLPWRESHCEVIAVNYDPINGVCLNHLKELLLKYHHRKLKIGAFSAASNVTGILTNVNAVSALMHRGGGIVIFDYATAAPYVKMNMNPIVIGDDAPFVYKDAIVFSGHKFIGGPGCPGVLIVKSKILPPQHEPPTFSGGGTVFYVSDDHHRYLSNRDEREEAGTPNIYGDIKLGLIIHLKQSLDPLWIEQEEFQIYHYVVRELSSISQLIVLGQQELTNNSIVTNRLPIFSIVIRCGARYLHHNFVCALLNDLFGIQARGGCQCAGPYSMYLLGINDVNNGLIEYSLLDKNEVVRPGYCRLSFPFWMNRHEIDYSLTALRFIAKHGWKFLSQYRYNHKTGEWSHSTRLTRFPERQWLSHFDLISATKNSSPGVTVHAAGSDYDSVIQSWNVSSQYELFERISSEAESLAKEAFQQIQMKAKKKSSRSNQAVISHTDHTSFEHIRWYTLSEELEEMPVASLDFDDDLPLLELKGPIVPGNSFVRLHDDDEHLSTMESCSVEITPYARLRSEKLRSHQVCKETDLPRYIRGLDDSSVAENGSSNHMKIKADALTSYIPQHQPYESALSARVEKIESVLSHTTDHVIDNGKIVSGKGSYYEGSNPPQIKFVIPPKKIMKLVGQAVKDWNMIESGDRLLLGLSGGKDSLALLHTLLALQRRAPVKFEVACATVDPQTSSFDPSPLIPYVQQLGVTYHFLSEPIVELAKSKLQGDSMCAFCSRFKRGLLYSCCRNFNYNKLVLAQHLDDLAESFFMSALHNGQIRTMKANYQIEAGDVRVIRPFIYVRETTTRDFSQQSKLPIINENCPACFEQPKERQRIKKLLQQEETMVPALFYNMKRALIPLMHDDTYEAMQRIAQSIEQNNVPKGQHTSRLHIKNNSDLNCSEDKKDNTSKAKTNGDHTEENHSSKRIRLGDENYFVLKQSKPADDDHNDSNFSCVLCHELA